MAPKSSCSLQFSANPPTTPLTLINVPVYGTNTQKSYFNLSVLPCSGATTLSASVSTLALSAKDTATNPALTGTARQITITNNGAFTANDLLISYPTWPTGTSAIPTCGTSLSAGSSCVITVTPGANSTSNCITGIAPTPGVISVSSSNANSVTTNVFVLNYGCIYQGGFLFSVDDTTNNGVTGTCSSSPCTGSIGGKVASLVDQAAPYTTASQATSIIWSSNGSGSVSANVSYDLIPLISEVSTPNDSYTAAQAVFDTTYSNVSTFPFPASSAFATCNGAIDGQCNSNNILALYDTYKTGYGIGASPYTLSSGPTNRTDYAAGLCTATINTYSDWYFPAICEMDAVSGFVTCPVGAQSMVANLVFLLGDPNAGAPSTSCSPPSGTDCLAGFYLSSTESSTAQQYLVWGEYFSVSSFQQNNIDKNLRYGVRCSRALTQ